MKASARAVFPFSKTRRNKQGGEQGGGFKMEQWADGIRCNKTKEGSIAATSVRLRSTGRKWRARVTMFLEESRSPTDDRLIIDVIIFARTTRG